MLGPPSSEAVEEVQQMAVIKQSVRRESSKARLDGDWKESQYNQIPGSPQASLASPLAVRILGLCLLGAGITGRPACSPGI